MELDFTYQSLQKMWSQFREKEYQFSFFPDDPERIRDPGLGPFIYLRHDIDFSLKRALEMAHLERQWGIQATYFFLLTSDFYNLYHKTSRQTVMEILSLGHQVGLHFDCANYPMATSPAEMELFIEQEKGAFSKLLGEKINLISFHRPEPKIYKGEWQFSKNIIHTYLPQFTREIAYVSDSRGVWKYGHPLQQEAFQQKKSLQVLIHPLWWTETGVSAQECLQHFFAEKTAGIDDQMSIHCSIYKGV